MAYPIHHMTNQATTTDNETLLRNLRLAAQALADSTGCTVTVRNDHGVLVYETE